MGLPIDIFKPYVNHGQAGLGAQDVEPLTEIYPRGRTDRRTKFGAASARNKFVPSACSDPGAKINRRSPGRIQR